ncbi:MAG: maleate cis-trans isomerase family protein [Nocardioidaceae bacterium]
MTSPPAATTASEPRPDRNITAHIPGPATVAHVGVVVPFDMALDHELWRWAPENVSLHFTRTPYSPLSVTVEMAEVVGDANVVAQATQDIAAMSPSICAYACASGSFVRGLAGERALVDAMRAVGVPRAVTTSGAFLRALTHLDVRRVSVATPYDEQVTAHLADFLAEAGVEVVKTSCMGLTSDIWTVPYVQTAELVEEADCPEAEAVLVSCTNLPTYHGIAPLEAELAKPVVTANQATMWAALTDIGAAPVGTDQILITT